MSTKIPLVLVGAEQQTLRSTDTLSPAALGTGTRDNTRFLRDDGTWQPATASISVTASEALAAGAWVNIYSNSGTANARNADATSTGKECWGFVLASVASSGTATVYFQGANTAVSSMTPGPIFLAVGSTGLGTSTPPSSSGNVVQPIGIAVSATVVLFERGTPVQKA